MQFSIADYRFGCPFATCARLCVGLAWLFSIVERVQAQRSDPPHAIPTIHMIGDSTMADKPLSPAQPERGWGQLLPIYVKHPEMVRNYAKNGRSSKSFESEGLWKQVESSLRPGDFVIIQFGHNDEKRESPERYTDPKSTYREQLNMYVNATRNKGAMPILATPIVRRRFDDSGRLVETHGAYPDAVRAVAQESGTPLLDLHVRTQALLKQYGPTRSKQLYLWIDPDLFDAVQQVKQDDTHLSADGASRICELAIEEMRRIQHPLASYAK